MIREATTEDLTRINEIIRTAKASHPSYSHEYVAAAIALLEVKPEWLEQNEGFMINNEGFLGLEIHADHVTLEHLWILPEAQAKGLGSEAIAFARARHARKSLVLLPDPPAEGFYEKLGACKTGVAKPSRIPQGPTFYEMAFKPTAK